MALKKPIVFDTTFARYSASDQIGQGGTGVVYKATDEKLQTVAIKVLETSKASPERRGRFKNELLFGERNLHQNIIRVIDHGLHKSGTETTPFYVMPFYASSLRKLISDGINLAKVLPLFAQCLDGVEAAHKQDVVHRDLKPENILFDPANQRLVIADFGIAEFAQDELYTLVETKPNTRLANFHYAAPEQRDRGGKCDQRTDIFALGLMLSEMLTRVIPHGTGYPTIAAAAPELAYLDDLVSWMIRQRLDDRPASIEVVKRELIGRGNKFVEQQAIDRLKQTVVPASDVEDPIANDPIRIVDFDWNDGVLTLILNQPVNQDWVQAIQFGGYSRSSAMGKGPERFLFASNRASVPTEADDVQRVIDYFKSWLPPANQIYVDRRKRAKEEEDRRAREALQREIQLREQRKTVLSQIKI